MFWTRYLQICEEHGVKPHAVLRELGISTGSAANWKKGSLPTGEILNKLAAYFDVSVEYIINYD